MSDIIIRNAQIVNEGQITAGDVLIKDGRVERIDAQISASASTEIDAAGNWLLPGMIDDQVHFREPGATHKGCIATESAAAVAGGITSYMDMPNTKPGTLDADALAFKKAVAHKDSVANYAFHFGVSKDNLDEVAAVDPNSVAGVKVFLGASTGNMLVEDPATLERLFQIVPTILLAHCEDTPMITANEEKWRATHGDDVPLSAHPLIRSVDACYKSSSMATELARKHGTRLHVLHLTTAKELALFEDKPLEDKHITAEVCVHHLTFDDRDYEHLGTRLKCNPAVKNVTDRDALRAALSSNRIDVIGTDHAPHTKIEKDNPYFQAPAGLPLAQEAVPALLELVHDDVVDLHTVVAKMSHRVADLFDIAERGYIREGYWADLVLIGNSGPDHTRPEPLSRCGWTPFATRTLRSHVDTTIVSGHVAWQNGQIRPRVRGQELAFDR